MQTPPAARGGAAVLIGTFAIAVGAGIGLRHLGLAGPTAVAVIATICGIVGLVLVAWGGFVVVRSIPGWWRLLAVPLGFSLLAFVLVPTAVALAVTVVAPTTLGDETPADRGLPYEDARFTTDDGVDLSGWYLPSTNGAAVVLLHGASSTRSNVLDEAEALSRAGFGVLLFDARGHGESGGTAMDFGWYGDQDTAAAVSWLAERAEVDPDRIGAVGSSMGGEEVIGAAASDPRIRAVVAEGATGRVAADRGWLPRHLGGWVQRGIDRVQYAAIDLLTEAAPPSSLRDAVGRISPRPVLLVVAGEEASEAEAAAYIRSGAPSSVQVWEVADAHHVEALATDPAAWSERVIGFLEASLGR